MATTFEIALPLGTLNAISAAEDALNLIDDLEAQLTVYRETSEICRINEMAQQGPVTVEQGLFQLLNRSVKLTTETNGAFDLATGALIKAWGFYRREGRIPPLKELAAAREVSGMKHVILNDNQTIKFRRPGLELNLGGIGKGYAIDRVVELLQSKWGITSALIHGGGSSAFALGCPPGQPRGWSIALKHPWNEHPSLGTVYLKDRGLGTSAATFQFFEYNKKKYGHLLDPRTGWPAERTANATVMAPTATEADALSTAFFVLGKQSAIEHCRTRSELAAVILPDEPDARPTTIGLSPGRYVP